MAKKSFKPSRNNRKQAIEELLNGLSSVKEMEQSLERSLGVLDGYIMGTKVGLVCGRTGHIAYDLTMIALSQRWSGLEIAGPALRRAFAVFYWSAELDLHERAQGHMGYDVHDDAHFEMLKWQGLSLACGETWFAEWLAPYLYNLFRGCAKNYQLGLFSVDEPARRFTETLLSVILTAQWPQSIEFEAMGAYAPLLATAGNPTTFSDAVVEFCDYRLSQCFGYAGIDATRRRSPSNSESIMDHRGWECLFPFELFTLKFAFEKATGKPLSLDADHPLLQTPLLKQPFPALSPLYDDGYTQKLRRFGEEMFGSSWKLRQEIPLAFEL